MVKQTLSSIYLENVMLAYLQCSMNFLYAYLLFLFFYGYSESLVLTSDCCIIIIIIMVIFNCYFSIEHIALFVTDC